RRVAAGAGARERGRIVCGHRHPIVHARRANHRRGPRPRRSLTLNEIDATASTGRTFSFSPAALGIPAGAGRRGRSAEPPELPRRTDTAGPYSRSTLKAPCPATHFEVE